jgi:hypothetical protein
VAAISTWHSTPAPADPSSSSSWPGFPRRRRARPHPSPARRRSRVAPPPPRRPAARPRRRPARTAARPLRIVLVHHQIPGRDGGP